jgi:hypothetical protein
VRLISLLLRSLTVMPGLGPGIHAFPSCSTQGVDPGALRRDDGLIWDQQSGQSPPYSQPAFLNRQNRNAQMMAMKTIVA